MADIYPKPDDGPLPSPQRLERFVARHGLTPRQGEVLALVVAGHANKEIARQLDCSHRTVELHVAVILRKTGSARRAALVGKFWSG